MIRIFDNVFVLDTDNTTYCFGITPDGHAEHLYYGRKITIENKDDVVALAEKHAVAPGNTTNYESDGSYAPEDFRYELSSLGKGDVREPFVEIIYPDGSFTSDFVYETACVCDEEMLEDLPCSYGLEEGNGVRLSFRDKNSGALLEVFYGVYEQCNVITRSARLINCTDGELELLRLMSNAIDFDDSDYIFTSFNGEWIREMERHETRLSGGKIVNSSAMGTSSSRANPFVMLSRPDTTEQWGDCYGFNLVYSANHYESAEVSGFGKLRFTQGINPQSFRFILQSAECFEAPQAVMTFSGEGFNAMSNNLHSFVREHIIRGEWRDKSRPVLINSWEANYFDITEEKLVGLAQKAKEAGVELFVMDDGWFGKRNDDSTSLGDWTPDEQKLPGGIEGICRKINEIGLDFGIWVEPEMISVKSELYKAHPDWAIEITGKNHSEGRNQRILDLTRDDVCEYVIERMSDIFGSAPIAYVKWDMNRPFTDFYSSMLDRRRQGEVGHRYIKGFYRCIKTLTERFPDILFEGCASGGNRFDLGMLCFFPQIWASDNSDAVCRSQIQTGYSFGYPMSSLTAHLSASPNHQTLRETSLYTRFNVAAFGIFGCECNLTQMSQSDLDGIKEKISIYKQWRELFQKGSFYRGRTGGNITEWTVVSPDKKTAAGLFMQKLAVANKQQERFFPVGLCPEKKYRFFSLGTDGTEIEECVGYGDTLMNGGVHLKQAFSGFGEGSEIRRFKDFDSRLYFMTEI